MIHLSKPYFDSAELNAVQEVLDSGWVAGQGPKNKELSEIIKGITKTQFAIPVNNCTAALHLALLAVGVGQGDEVLVSDFTFPATGHSVMYCGAKPVFVDVKSNSYSIDPEKIEEKITGKTKAMIIVHALGQMADMDRIIRLADKYDLKVIEDAACALGAKYKGRPAGSFGHLAAFSFHARKNATSGEGGVVVTNNKEYAEKISSLSCFGMESALDRQQSFSIPSFNSLGYNYKLSDINAAIVIEQIKKYPKVLLKRKKLVAKYNDLLKDVSYLKTPEEGDDQFHVYQTYALLLDENINRNDLILSLKAEGIQTQIGTYSSFNQPVYNSSDNCPISLKLYNQTLALPLYHELNIDEVDIVVEKLNEHIKKQISYKTNE